MATTQQVPPIEDDGEDDGLVITTETQILTPSDGALATAALATVAHPATATATAQAVGGMLPVATVTVVVVALTEQPQPQVQQTQTHAAAEIEERLLNRLLDKLTNSGITQAP